MTLRASHGAVCNGCDVELGERRRLCVEHNPWTTNSQAMSQD